MSSSSRNVPCALSSQPVGREQPQGTTPLRVADGTLEALKWLALVLMALDHTNKFLFKEKLPVLFEMGRLAMPTFAFVLAYNLTRPGAFAAGAHVRTMGRLKLPSIGSPCVDPFGNAHPADRGSNMPRA